MEEDEDDDGMSYDLSDYASSNEGGKGSMVLKKKVLYDNTEKKRANDLDRSKVKEYNDLSYKVDPNHIKKFMFKEKKSKKDLAKLAK